MSFLMYREKGSLVLTSLQSSLLLMVLERYTLRSEPHPKLTCRFSATDLVRHFHYRVSILAAISRVLLCSFVCALATSKTSGVPMGPGFWYSLLHMVSIYILRVFLLPSSSCRKFGLSSCATVVAITALHISSTILPLTTDGPSIASQLMLKTFCILVSSLTVAHSL